MQFTVYKYFLKSTLKSTYLWLTSSLMSLSFILVLSIFIFALQGNSNVVNEMLSLMGLILFIIAIVSLTMINVFIFSKYFANSMKDGTVSLEIRSGISKTKIFFERILLSKTWSFSLYLFFTILILIFGGISNSHEASIYLFNLSVGFLIVLIYDLFITSVLATISTFGSNILLGVFSVILILWGGFIPLVSSFSQLSYGSTFSSRQLYQDYEKYIIANDVRNLAKKIQMVLLNQCWIHIAILKIL